MTVQELIEISTLSSGTIANLTGFSDYEEQEFFIQWAFTEMFNGTLNGQAAAFGSGPFEACKNLAVFYLAHGPMIDLATYERDFQYNRTRYSEIKAELPLR